MRMGSWSDTSSVIRHFDHTLSYLEIIPINSGTYLGTKFAWSIKLGHALLHEEYIDEQD